MNSERYLPDFVLLMDLFLVNRSRAGIGYCSGACNEQGLFKSGGSHADQPAEEEAAAVIEEEDAEDLNNFIIPGGVCHNWVAVDVTTVIHKSA